MEKNGIKENNEKLKKEYLQRYIPIFAYDNLLNFFIEGYYLTQDVKNASPKFQRMIEQYQSLAFKSVRYRNRGNVVKWDIYLFKVTHAYNKLLKEGKREKIRYYFPEEIGFMKRKLKSIDIIQKLSEDEFTKQ